MKYWLDTEFIEDGRTIDLLSIGIVAEDGRELYAEFDGAPIHKANAWVAENVLPHLSPCLIDPKHSSIGCHCPIYQRWRVRNEIVKFVEPGWYGKPEFWGYYADYDWVALCQLFGTMIDLPKDWPMYCRDLKQWCDDLGNPQLPKQKSTEHHALADARWNREAWDFLNTLRG